MPDIPDFSDLIALSDLPNKLPRVNGKKIHLATCHRWRLSGRLPCVKIGTRYFVTPETLRSLVENWNAPKPLPTRREAKAGHDWARAYLRSQGF